VKRQVKATAHGAGRWVKCVCEERGRCLLAQEGGGGAREEQEAARRRVQRVLTYYYKDVEDVRVIAGGGRRGEMGGAVDGRVR